MGWGRAFAAIASATGNDSRAWMWLATDFFDTIQERNDREENRKIEEWNRVNAIAEWEHPRLMSWAWGDEFLSTYKGTGLDEVLIHQWNKRHGHTLKLFFANGWPHNMSLIAHLWLKVGKP